MINPVKSFLTHGPLTLVGGARSGEIASMHPFPNKRIRSVISMNDGIFPNQNLMEHSES